MTAQLVLCPLSYLQSRCHFSLLTQMRKDPSPGLLWSHWQDLPLPQLLYNSTSLQGGMAGYGHQLLSQGPFQCTSSGHIQEKRNEEEGPRKTELAGFVAIRLERFYWLETSQSLTRSHRRHYTERGPWVRDPGPVSEAARTSWEALLLKWQTQRLTVLGTASGSGPGQAH